MFGGELQNVEQNIATYVIVQPLRAPLMLQGGKHFAIFLAVVASAIANRRFDKFDLMSSWINRFIYARGNVCHFQTRAV